MNQDVSMNTVYRFCYGAVKTDLRKDAIVKRQEGLRNIIHDYYGEVVVIIGTRQNHSEVLLIPTLRSPKIQMKNWS